MAASTVAAGDYRETRRYQLHRHRHGVRSFIL